VKLLDLFCGVGGWSERFRARGWYCVGVDLAPFAGRYAGDQFIQSDARALSRSFIDSFDAVVASPPCDDFARAWLPWLRCDKQPSAEAADLLRWSVALCDRPRRVVECSKFAARHVPGAVLHGSYALWGDVPLLLPELNPRHKERLTGRRPELRAKIPAPLADSVAAWLS
jgi:hypothetical protein